MTSRLARAIVGRYPLAWRERYADEVFALLDDSPARVADVFELSRGLIVERAKSLIEPGDHPTAIDWTLRPMAHVIKIAPAVSLVLGGAAVGELLARRLGEPPAGVWMVAVAVCAAVMFVTFRTRRAARPDRDWPTNAGLVIGAFVYFVAMQWHASPGPSDPVLAGLHAWTHPLKLFVATSLVHYVMKRRVPWRPMFDAVERYRAAARCVRHAQADVDACLRAADRSAGWQLQAAQATLAQFARERDEALAVVDTYGYRARFQP